MPVRTKLLAAGRVSTATTTVVYTVPAGETAILKSIKLANVNTTTAVTAVILMDAGAFNQTIFQRHFLDANTDDYVDLWVVCPPGCEIAILLNTAIGVNFWLSGTELEGVAD